MLEHVLAEYFHQLGDQTRKEDSYLLTISEEPPKEDSNMEKNNSQKI